MIVFQGSFVDSQAWNASVFLYTMSRNLFESQVAEKKKKITKLGLPSCNCQESFNQIRPVSGGFAVSIFT